MMSAFFVYKVLTIVACAFLFTPDVLSANCTSHQYDAGAMVLRVIDGDTLLLTDDRKIRLIGINAPELAHYPKQAEPFALSAKQFIETTLSLNKTINIKYGKQRKDRYGRILAHVFLNDGQNLNAMLLEKGLASAIAVPPNLQFNQCYFSVEQHARKSTKSNVASIWTDKYSHYINASKINSARTGFYFVKGKVQRIGRSRDSIWIQLASYFTIRIKRKDYKYFTNTELDELKIDQLVNKMLYVRGWVYRVKDKLFVQLRHPEMMQVLEINH